MLAKIAKSFYTVLVALGLAIAYGKYFPEQAQMLKTVGNMYMSIILMAVIPLLFSLLLSSIIKISTGQTNGLNAKRIFSFISVTLFAAAFMGSMLAIVLHPAQGIAENPSIAAQIYDDMIKNITEVELTDKLASFDKFKPQEFLKELIPQQVVKPFVEGNIMQLLILALIIGLAIAKLSADKSHELLGFLKTTYDLFQKILKATILLMPLGLFAIVSSSIAIIDGEIVESLTKFFIQITFVNLSLLTISVFVTCRVNNISVSTFFTLFKEPLIIAFSTSSNQATVPFLMKSIDEGFGYNPQQTALVAPLCVALNRTATVLYFAFLSIFIAQLYNTPLSIYHMIFIIFGSMILGIAATGVNGVISLTMLGIILQPLGLPFAAIIPILIMIDPLLEPLRTVTSLVSNIATTTMILRGKGKKAQKA